MDDLESDFSAFHGMDIWDTSMATLMRMAPKLVVYGGALALAVGRDARPASAVAAPVSYTAAAPQAAAENDTPPDEVASMWQRHLIEKYRSMGVEVTGIQPISDTEMERLVRGGG